MWEDTEDNMKMQGGSSAFVFWEEVCVLELSSSLSSTGACLSFFDFLKILFVLEGKRE